MLVRLQLNELIVQSLGSTATARSLFQGRKATQSLRRIVARLSTKLQAGSSLLTCIRLILLEHFGVKFGKITVAVNPAYTSQKCSNCGTHVKKSLSMRTHVCQCGFILDRDWNAAINILKLALSTTGHVGTWVDAERSRSIDPNASGDSTSTLVGAILSGQVGSMNEESPWL